MQLRFLVTLALLAVPSCMGEQLKEGGVLVLTDENFEQVGKGKTQNGENTILLKRDKLTKSLDANQ